MDHSLVVCFVGLFLVTGCQSVSSRGSSDDTDFDSDTYSDGESDTETETDSDSDTETDTGTGSDECGLGTYEGDILVYEPEDLEAYAGYTAATGGLVISQCEGCLDLTALHCLTSVGDAMWIQNNDSLLGLDGLNALTTVGWQVILDDNSNLASLDGLSNLTNGPQVLSVCGNASLPYCEVCDLVSQFVGGLDIHFVLDNLADECWVDSDLDCP